MASEKVAARQDNDEEDDDSSEDFPKGDEEIDKKKSTSLTGILNAKIAALAVASLVIGILIGQVALPGLGVGLVSLPSSDGGNGSDNIDMAALQAKVQSYIQKAVESQQAGVSVEVTSIETFNEGFYTVNFDILKDGEVQNSSMVLLTKDGLALVGSQPMMLDEPIPEQPAQQQAQTFSYKDVQPQPSAGLEAFIVSGCPYGLQMQRILAPIATGLGANIKVRYIGSIENGTITSMHGDAEAQENLRQICIREEQADKYWPYVSEYMKKGNTESALTIAGIDKAKLNTCMTDASKGLKYAQADFDLANSRGVSGSPTLFLNGSQVSEYEFGADNNATGSERSAENVKNLLCYGFTAKPAACSTVLAKEPASSNFSEQYSGGTVSGGSC